MAKLCEHAGSTCHKWIRPSVKRSCKLFAWLRWIVQRASKLFLLHFKSVASFCRSMMRSEIALVERRQQISVHVRLVSSLLHHIIGCHNYEEGHVSQQLLFEEASIKCTFLHQSNLIHHQLPATLQLNAVKIWEYVYIQSIILEQVY